MFELIEDILKAKEVKFKKNISLATLSTIRIGGACEAVIYPDTEEKLIFTLRLFTGCGIKYKVLGRMSNVLPPDGAFFSVVVKTDAICDIEYEDGLVYSGVGVSLPVLAGHTARLGLSGLEELSGIPGSVGGALFGNAGAYGREICELLCSVRAYLPESDDVITLSSAEMTFGYRDSCFKRGDYILLSARFRLSETDSSSAMMRIDEYRRKRLVSSPREPSLGSTFKRPVSGYASKMIDECGLRGSRVGDAAISEKHAGYIVNLGRATALDVMRLVEIAENAVYKKFGIRLEREIEYL